MITTKQLAYAVDHIAPFSTALEWDNCGLLVDSGESVHRILFALDATKEVIEEASARDCEAIVTHHPIIFSGLRRLASDDPVMLAAHRGISVISAHTCFDAADGGVNDVLCTLLGLTSVVSFGGIGRSGTLPEMSEEDFITLCKRVLHRRELPVVSSGKPIRRVAVVGGSGGDSVELAASLGCDAFVTGELKHHEALQAQALGITAVAAGHFATENPAVPVLCDLVSHALNGAADCIVSEISTDPFSYV